MSDTVAYALREEYAGTVTQVLEADADGNPTKTVDVPAFGGGLIALGDDDELDLAEALEAGGGTITVDASAKPLAVTILDELPVLKRVRAPIDADVKVGYRDRTAKANRDEASNRGIAGAARASAEDLVAALEADDARAAAGEDPPIPYSVEGLTVRDENATPEA